jgi:hypothetical protein
VAKPSTSLLKRRLDIAEIVRKNGEIKVDDLAEMLAVSGVTRLRVTVKDPAKVADLAAWKAEGALSLLVKGDGIQAVYGPKADVLKSDINDIL